MRGGSLGRGRQTTLGVVDDGYFGDFGGYVFEKVYGHLITRHLITRQLITDT